MPIGQPNTLTQCRRFFAEPDRPRQRQYEALRAYFLDNIQSPEVARRFGYTPGSFRVLCCQFRRRPHPEFFLVTRPGPRHQPQKTRARQLIVQMRKQNYSVYDISASLKEQNMALS